MYCWRGDLFGSEIELECWDVLKLGGSLLSDISLIHLFFFPTYLFCKHHWYNSYHWCFHWELPLFVCVREWHLNVLISWRPTLLPSNSLFNPMSLPFPPNPPSSIHLSPLSVSSQSLYPSFATKYTCLVFLSPAVRFVVPLTTTTYTQSALIFPDFWAKTPLGVSQGGDLLFRSEYSIGNAHFPRSDLYGGHVMALVQGPLKLQSIPPLGILQACSPRPL